jgi:hypothetical protein
MVMWLCTSCNLEFQMGGLTPLILMLRPRSGSQQWVAREAYTLSPSVPVEEYTDIFGNLCQRLVVPAGSFSVHTSADVMTADVVDKAPGAFFLNMWQGGIRKMNTTDRRLSVALLIMAGTTSFIV